EDGIRAGHVTGVQTCALPISLYSGAIRNVKPLLKRTKAWLAVLVEAHDLAIQNCRASQPSGQRVANLRKLEPLRLVVSAQQCQQIGRASCRERVEAWSHDGS